MTDSPNVDLATANREAIRARDVPIPFGQRGFLRVIPTAEDVIYLLCTTREPRYRPRTGDDDE